MATQNPITLLIGLGADSKVSQQNINTYVQSLKKYYDRNPLLISLGINKGSLEGELNKLSREIKSVDVDVNFKGNNSKALSSLENQVTKIINQVKELNGRLNSLGSQSGSGSNSLGRNLSSDIGKAIAEIERLKNSNRLATEEIRRMQGEITRLNTQLNGLGDGARRATRETNTLGSAFSQAFTKFPIWMLATTAFYAPLRGIQDLTERVIELDSALISLQRVSDAPLYQFNETIEYSLKSVRELSGVTSQYLETLSEFARMDNTLKEATALTDTATILSNISDLDAQESVSALMSATLAFNIAKEDSIRIADSLNEVDNNYSVTTKDLALSMNKAAQSAKTYGVEMETLIGYTTAISASTRESGSVTGNSLKTIMSRIATLSGAQEALSEVGVAVRDSGGEMRKVEDIITDLGEKWKTLNAEEQSNTLIKVAGTHHQNRLAALLNNFTMSVDASKTALESQGSAMREQEKYNQSLEARLNRLSNAWTSFASTVGDTVLYDGIVVVTSALESMTDGGNSVVSTIGLLPPIMVAATVAVYTFSGSFRTLVASTYASVTATVAATGVTGLFSTALVGLRTVAGLATVALRGLMIATGIGIAFAGVGFIIEKLTNIISDNIQKQEEFDTYLNKNSSALTDNREAVEELITKYNDLSTAKENGIAWDSTKEEEYLKVQQRLGELYPALIAHTDASGQAHLKTSEEIKKEVDITNELIKAQNELTLASAIEEFDKLNDTISGGRFDSFDNFIDGSLEARIEGAKKKIEMLEKQGDTKLAAQAKLDLLKLEQQVTDTSDQIKGEMLKISDAVDMVKIEPAVAKDMENFLRGLDVSNLDSTNLTKFSKEFGALQTQLQEAINNGDEALYKETIDSINNLAKTTKNADFKEFSKDYDGMIKSIDDGKNVIVDAENDIDGLGIEAEGSQEQLSGLAKEMKDFKDITESMAGASQSGVDTLNDLLFQYDMLTHQLSGYTEQQLQDIYTKETLTSKERDVKDIMDKRIAVMKEMSSIYPDLLGKDGKAIAMSEEKRKAIEAENKANEILLKAYKMARDGKLNAEQQATLASASGTKARIENLKTEIRMLEKYTKANNIASKIASAFSGVAGLALTAQQIASEQALSGYQAELNGLIGSLNTDIGNIESFSKAIEESEKGTKKSNKTQKDSNSTTKESIYITNEYKEKIEELNLAIEKQQKLQSTLPEHSDGYKKSLESQIKLEKEKLSVMEKQAKSIESQIKSGKIKQTGTISNKSDSSTTRQLSGFNGRITSKFGERADNHRGTDIASAKGTGIDSFASGKVIAAGYAGKKGAEKMHSSYGNVVVVQSDDGTKRLYAHMEEVLVKVGQQIDAGTKIGTVGSTGNSTGPHLHYEKTQNGKLVDSYSEVMQARKGVATTSSSSGVSTVDNSQHAIDQAKSDLNGLSTEILNQQEAIANLEKKSIDTALSSYEFKKSNYDKFLENSDNRLNKLTKSSQAYRDELDRQVTSLNAKKSVNQAEITHLKELIASGELNDKVVAEYTNTLHELGKANSEIDFSLKDVETSKLESYMDLVDEVTSKYDEQRRIKDSSIEYDTIALDELDTASLKYVKSLEKINSTMKEKQNINRYELNNLEQLIANSLDSGEALEKAKNRVQELNKEIKQLQLDIQDGNFNIIVNVKTQSDAKIDDMQFELDRADAIRKMYEEGSADYASYTQKMIDASKKMAEQHLKTRDALVEELKQRDIKIERRKEILELLEDEHMAYLNATLAIKDYTKQMEDSVDAQRKEIANNVINALKDAYQEYRDERMKMIDEEIKRENEKHEQIMKQLNDEMDLFRKNVEEKLRLIDRQEAERDYNMEIDDMEKERSKVQSQINLLSMDNSNEAKSKRKKLQEQLDKIDKDIAEKRHDRDIELQKQGLNDLLESKEDEINGKIEVQDKEHEAVLKSIERQKEYWDKYYTDLLNDERKFAQIREDIMKGHFDKVQNDLQQHIDDLTATMPQLVDTMDGTMQAVGTAIRQNVIDNLREAMKMINEFNSMQNSSGGFDDGLGSSGGIGNIVGDAGLGGSSGSEGQSSQNKLVSDADLKVIMAKYMTDVLASQYNDVRANNIREKAHAFAREGRAEGSAIDVNSHYNTELAKLSKDDKIRLGNLASSNSEVFESTEMQNALKRWSSSLKSRASALSGGMTSWNGNGIDGKGGKEMIVHPNELINSPLDTQNLLNMSNVMQRATQFFTPLLKSMIKPTSLMNSISNSNGGDTYEIIFTGDINNTTKDGAKQFGAYIMNDIRTRKGGKL